jgi:hypothetical protein
MGTENSKADKEARQIVSDLFLFFCHSSIIINYSYVYYKISKSIKIANVEKDT